MLYLIFKAAVSGVLIAIISEVSRKYPGWGGLLASLPLTSLIALMWLWRDTGDPVRVSQQAISTFWFVLPSLPLFLVIPWLLRSGVGFWVAILLSSLLTIILYVAMAAVSARLGIKL